MFYAVCGLFTACMGQAMIDDMSEGLLGWFGVVGVNAARKIKESSPPNTHIYNSKLGQKLGSAIGYEYML